ncbi:hypothetical protein LRS10_04630 [Phenylobacterium sp. J426]|nr:hypothetical protein [Phenylobacterium sp. J426]MCR5873530.1 hypothetical protein [Phenylobacterium sp. J426]
MLGGRAAPARSGEQFVGRSHGLQATAEIGEEGLQRGRAFGGLDGERLDRGEHVLHAVVQLGHQFLALVVLEAPGGDILDDAGDADRPVAAVALDDAGDAKAQGAAVVGADVPELGVEGV